MTDINLQTLTPDTTLPTTGFLFGADSQASGSPSVYTVQSVATTLLGSTTLTGATITADAPVLNLAQTWNNAAITFTGLKLNATDTASAAASLLLDIGTGGGTYASKFNVSKAGVVRAGDGTATAPTYSFISQPLTGFYLSSATAIDFAVSNAARIRFGSGATSISVFSDSGSILFGSASDAILTRDTTNTLAQRNGVNAQTFRVYNTFTDASNYERLNSYFTSNIAVIETAQAGTGAARVLLLRTTGANDLRFGSNGVTAWKVSGSGQHFLADTDNTYDIGAVGATRPRSGYFGTNVVAGGYVSAGASLRTTVELWLGDNIGAPAATVGYAKIYVDSADGDLKVIFGDGTVKTIVTDT